MRRFVFVLLITFLFLLFGLFSQSYALLIDNGNGTITQKRDDGITLMWLKDARMSGGVRVWSDLIGRTGAIEWAEDLVYSGYNDWRLPITLQPDLSCSDQSIYRGVYVSQGWNCAGSELGYLFYNELGGTAGWPISTSADPDIGLFINLIPIPYWSGTEFAPRPGDAWFLDFASGLQAATNEGGIFTAWAVRDVTSVPEPTTFLLISSGLIGLAYGKKKLIRK